MVSKKIFAVVLALLISSMLLGGCGEKTTFSLGNRTVGQAQINDITLKKSGNAWKLQGSAVTKKDGMLTFTLSAQKDKTKSKIVVKKEIALNKTTPIDETAGVTGNIKDWNLVTVAFQPYEFTTKDYPMDPGTQLVYYSEKETQGTEKPAPFPVSFNLQGPWDFSQGPTEGQIVYDYIGPKDSPDAADFPEANAARKNSGPTSATTYFYKRDPSSILIFGSSTKTLLSALSAIEKYSPPEITYKMPFKVGDTWSSSSELSYSGLLSGKGREDFTTKAISKNSVKVPQGQYDISYLIQEKYHSVDPDGAETNNIYYTWLVPSVGAVAYMYSVNGEQNEVFSQATGFWRLKYKGKTKPGL